MMAASAAKTPQADGDADRPSQQEGAARGSRTLGVNSSKIGGNDRKR